MSTSKSAHFLVLIIARRSYFFLRCLLASKNDCHHLDSGIGRSAVAVMIRIFISKFYESSIKLVIWVTEGELGIRVCRLISQRGVLFQWRRLFTIVRRLWNARVSNSYTPLSGWLGVLSRENYFCSIAFFTGLQVMDRTASAVSFERLILKFYILIVFRKGLFPFLLCLSLSFSGIP